MRTHLRTATGVLLAALLWGVGVGAAEASQATEVAWATIRDGVFVDQAKWHARFAELDPGNKNEVRKLRRLIRDQLLVIEDVGIEQGPQGLPRLFCLYEAAYTAREAAMELNDALAVALEGHQKGFREPFRRGQEMVREYWGLRDGVDCSTAGEVTAFQEGYDDGSLPPFRLVTGRRVDRSPADDPESASVLGPVVSASGLETHERFEWSDPLLPPKVTSWRDTDALTHFVGLTAGSLLLEGPDGYWSGTLTAHALYGQEQGTWLLTGHGAYEGLSAMLTTTEDLGEVSVDGVIFPALLPPVPEPPAPLPD